MSTDTPRVGQLWASNDGRNRSSGSRQHLRVVAVADYVTSRNAPSPYAHLNNEDTGIDTWVRFDRMRPTSTGYRLIEDVPTTDSRAPRTAAGRNVAADDLRAAIRNLREGKYGMLADLDQALIFAYNYGRAEAAADPIAENALRLRSALAFAGFKVSDPCDACGGKRDPREPDVECAWCGEIGIRVVRAAALPAPAPKEGEGE